MLKVVILAAGAGTRMKSKIPKVLHKIIDKSMLDYVIDSAIEAGALEVCVVVGHMKDQVMAEVKHQVVFVEQDEQLGTGHAVMQAKSFIGTEGQTLILFGDTPMITGSTLKKMQAYHQKTNQTVTVLSTLVEDSSGYGRIVRDQDGEFMKSVEHKDASDDERAIKEINSGRYLFEAKALVDALVKITTDNTQGEYYLPDTLNVIMDACMKDDAMVTSDYQEILGINNKVQLAEAGKIIQTRINQKLMLSGVTITDPEHTYIGKDVTVDADAIILPGTTIVGLSHVSEDAIIGPNSYIDSSIIGEGTKINQSNVFNSKIGEHTTVGPYAYIRPNCTIGNHIKIGDFVEIKNAIIEDGSKVSHLTYIGDADVGKNVNFGCGTVVVNYDGVNKNRATIKDNAFIGCNTNLISPVVVEENAYTAAGSTISKNVPSYALGIARAKQINIDDWVKRKRN
ncbi:MAG: bifunctional UDP-N-acetylglucosamine diphosphorylase/glucosamine-1-phosphate N-acetyltransferase GlmU [Vallitaleaceae bacterium]|jgi:bifunctional UDP-N-acetylglucosamine pyrophosphorylase/glucosamine-1-phosphate N-acetyltransferase|nr:bifunctional UDP-N-acetylglucosamine diphosphorylase/glucosamine-1-phosphate N-acetyltransferase GlmU [Vallitaleaceae bacterium]